MIPQIDAEAVFGDVQPIPVPVTAADATVLQSDCRLLGWSLRDAAGEIGLQAEGQAVAPGAGAAIVTLSGIPAGIYTVNWTVSLQGAAAAADANNFQLKNGAAVVENAINAGAAGAYPQVPVQITVAAGTSVTINAIGAGTAGVTYLAQIELVPIATPVTRVEIQDTGNILGEACPGENGSDTRWLGSIGVPCQGQIKVHIISGTIAGVVYAKLSR